MESPTAAASTSSLTASPPLETSQSASKQSLHLELLTLEAGPRSPQSWHEHWRDRLSARFPKLARVATTCVVYARGPVPPVLLPAPVPLLHRIPPRLPLETRFKTLTRRCTSPYFLAAFIVAYIISLSFLVQANSFFTPAEDFINCIATYWLKDDGCGLNGTGCAPFSNSTFDFRCPAQCSAVILQNQRAVGDQEVEFVPLVVGGGDVQNGTSGTYRGDSFICAAAVHSGLISDRSGGCATVSLIGTYGNFLSSKAHGITSTAFPGEFPLSMRMSPTQTLSHCADLRNDALAFNILVTVILFLVLRPKPVVLFWCMVCIGYWHITFFSDSRNTPPPISDAFGDFLPALFVAYAIWRVAFRHVLPAFSDAPIERLVWYLPFYWLGVLFNVTTSVIPIDRLLASDIAKRPGALTALIIVCIVILSIVVNQIRVMRKTGWVPFYLWRYVVVGLLILVGSQLPGLTFRLHHYFFAILLMPVTAFPTRLSAVYQAFLLGTFLDGIAKFGFASILQTAADLQRDAPLGTSLPVLLTNSTTYNASIPLALQTLQWAGFPATNEGWNGYALLIDDVERYVGTATNFSLAALDAALPHFFRLAFQKDGDSGDFARAAVLWPNGTWVDPAPGPS